MNFIHVHASGRFDRSPQSLEDALDKYVYSQHADLITLTEISSKPRSSRLQEKGWKYVQARMGGRKSDSAIMYKASVWKLHHSDYSLIYPGDGKGILPVWAVIAVLEHIASGKVVVVSSAHMPRSVEGPNSFSRSEAKRVAAYLVAAKNWRSATSKIADAENADAVMLAADWNLSIRKKWVKNWFAKKFPRFVVNWRGKLPQRGTHEKRIIDLALLRGLNVNKRPSLLAHNSSSDHTAYVETLSFK